MARTFFYEEHGGIEVIQFDFKTKRRKKEKKKGKKDKKKTEKAIYGKQPHCTHSRELGNSLISNENKLTES